MRQFASILACLLLLSVAARAQQRITGHVIKSATMEPLAGVSVTSKTGSATTDSTGRFSITAATGDNLTISYVGMQSTTVKVTGAQDLSVELKENQLNLDQVVVVGYTSQRKQDLTGAVAVVDLAPVKNNSSGNTMQALQGRVAGLYIEKDGSPNGANSRILIRGANTLGNNDPLYVIDGIPTTRPEVFQNMDPANIASVQVLKDASAESIYGARASNGGNYCYHPERRQYQRQSAVPVQ